MNRSPLRRGFLLLPLALAWLALSPTARAVNPPPDGGYPNGNTAEGEDALFSLTAGIDNTAMGFDALYYNTTGNYNTATGYKALLSNTTGSNNTANGLNALGSNTVGSDNTANGYYALFSNTIGYFNTASGVNALFSNTTGYFNTATGKGALNLNTTGSDNTASGLQALSSNTVGNFNTANGVSALFNNTTGVNNTAEGVNALLKNTTGSNNIAFGVSAGTNLTTGSNNIDIGNAGVAGESKRIRIGTAGTQTKTFIAGISGATVASGVGVIVGSNGQLGTAVSSERFKDTIRPMDKASEAILALKPVTFRYKKELDPESIPQFGLVAEEVEKVNHDLVARDDKGKPYTVRYEAVNAMLLNEFLKEHRRVEEQAATIAQLRTAHDRQTAALAAQEKKMKSLEAALNEQAAQIQKVSGQLAAAQPATRLVTND